MLNYLMLKWNLFKAKFFGEENGAVDLIVIIILIVVVVGLAILFRDRITSIINNLLNKLDQEASQI